MTETCTPRDTDALPKTETYAAKLAGQDAWIHSDGSAAGYFHTFDVLKLGSAPAHKVHVLLPKDYAKDCARYPVIYFHDGNTTFWKGGAVNKTWDVQAALAKGYAGGTIPRVIVVAIEPIERNREYTHAPWLVGQSCCEVAAYVTWLADSLKPFIDGAYRTRAAAKDTTIAGSSHGGLAAFITATSRPEAFGNAIAMSSSFWAGLDGTDKNGPLSTSALVTNAASGLAKKPRLYIDWGLVRTGGEHNSIIEDLATKRGIEMRDLLVASYGYTLDKDLFAIEDGEGGHDEESWARRIGPALEKILAP